MTNSHAIKLPTNQALDRAIEHITALPKPPRCPGCKGVIEAEWWSYCAACGNHLAANGVLRDDGERAPTDRLENGETDDAV